MAVDKPQIDLVLSDLEKEILKPEPFTVVIGANKRITFKDPFDFRVSERDEIFTIYEAAKRGEADDMDFLVRILSPADFKKLQEADLKIRLHEAMVSAVMKHFEGPVGDSGNAPGSNS